MNSSVKFLTTVFIVFGLILTGCESKDSQESEAKWTIGMSQCNLGEPWRVQMNADIKSAAQNYPEIEVVYKDAQNDTLKQRSQMEEFISASVDVIIISPKV